MTKCSFIRSAAAAISSLFILAALALPSSARFAGVAEPPPAGEPVRLWPEGAPGALGDTPEDVPVLIPYLLPGERVRPAMIVCPGGGYAGLAPHEAEPVARWFNEKGAHAFVLRYRHGPKYGHPAPLRDAQRAIRLVRAGAGAWRVDPSKIGILGFSAGGHLASTAGTHFDGGDPGADDPIERQGCRPDLMVLVYPVISMTDIGHAGSRRNLLGPEPDPALVAELSNETRVTPETPPAFLVHTADDAAVDVMNSLLFAQALRRAKVDFDLHVYEHGPHGFGMGEKQPDEGLRNWTAPLAAWLRRHEFIPPAAISRDT